MKKRALVAARVATLTFFVNAVWSPHAGAELSVTGIDPTHGRTAGGFALTIVGTEFSDQGNAATVGGAECIVTTETAEKITCAVPPGVGKAKIIAIRDALGNVRQPPVGNEFSYDPPIVTDVMPANAATIGGTPLTIHGDNFGPSGTARTVTVGSAACPLEAGTDSHTQLTCTLPPGQGHDLVVGVTLDGQTSMDTTSFTYDPPSITSITPTSGRIGGGYAITINGANFGVEALATVGGASCPVTLQSHTSLECTAPAGSSTAADVRVSAGGQSSNVRPFTYVIVASKCDAAKWKAVGTYAACLANESAKGAAKGQAPDAAKVAKCDTKFTASCAKAETKLTGCSQPGTCGELRVRVKDQNSVVTFRIQ